MCFYDQEDDSYIHGREIDPSLVAQLQAKLSEKYQLLSKELPSSIKESRLLSLFHYATDCGFNEKVRRAILFDIVSSEAQVDGE